MDGAWRRPDDMKTELAVKQLFRRLQREEDERKGDYSGIGSRYGYCRFVGPSLRVNKAIRNQVAKLHATLGHPSGERLARMLKLQGARAEVVQAAKDLRCEICARVHPPLSAPKSSATGPERMCLAKHGVHMPATRERLIHLPSSIV